MTGIKQKELLGNKYVGECSLLNPALSINRSVGNPQEFEAINSQTPRSLSSIGVRRQDLT